MPVVKAAAVQASGDEEWNLRIVGPLRVTVGDLVSGIERRQRGLDAQQEEVQRRIGELCDAITIEREDSERQDQVPYHLPARLCVQLLCLLSNLFQCHDGRLRWLVLPDCFWVVP